MLLDPKTHELFTDEGLLIKKLKCPIKVEWDTLMFSPTSVGSRFCKGCNKMVIDTSLLNEGAIIELLKKNPSACLKIDFNQINIKITNGIK